MIELPKVGDTFCEKYELREILGEGGFSTVFRATDAQMSRDVAIKVIEPREAGYPRSVIGRFLREGRVLASLVDPHNITMFEFGETDDGLLYMVFEFVDGRELRELLRKRGPLEATVVAHILDQVLRGLAEAHEAGILHRDVKPANVMLYEYAGDPFCVKLLDFGIARPAHDDTDTPVTSDGMVVGTPRYMSPEQLLGAELTPASDLFSVGLLAYEMLAGRPAFDAEAPRNLARQQFADDPIRLPDGYAPAPFAELIEQMLERDTDKRPQTAGEVLRRMRESKRELAAWEQMDHATTAPHRSLGDPSSAAVDDTPAASPQDPRPVTPRRRRRRYGTAAIGLAVVALLVGAVLAVVLLKLADDDEQVTTPPRPAVGLIRVRAPAGPDEPPSDASGSDAVGDVAPDLTTVADGCGADAGVTGLTSLGAATEVGQRRWAAYLPRDYEPATPHPVVIAFHRSVMDGEQMLEHTSLTRRADQAGFVLLAPTSLDEQFPWVEQRSEIDFVRRMVARSAERFCIDLSQIYLVGLGRGGDFASEVECAMPVSGIAVTLSGEGFEDAVCAYHDHEPAPRIRIYGRQDRYVPVNGGVGCMMFGDQMMNAREIEESWKEQHGCGSRTRTWLNEPGGTCRTWNCDVPFMHCETSGGHDWPGAPADPIELPTCEEQIETEPIDYGTTIWRFFSENGRSITPATSFDWGTYDR